MNLVGDLDENILDVIPNIQSEIDCKQSCLAHPNCSFYTYFFPNDTIHHQHCFLQTEFVGPQQPCETCITGPADCSNHGCSLSMNGEKHKALILTSVGQTSEIEVINDWDNVTCNITLFVVGGGGLSHSSGGGGSGYLEYRSLKVAARTRL